MGVPEDRAASCAEEFDQAFDAWGAVLDEAMDRGPGNSFLLSGGETGAIGRVLTGEVVALKDELHLSHALDVRVEPYGEANAFSDPADRAITFCTEYDAELSMMGRTVLN